MRSVADVRARLARVPWHPVLLAVFPALSLYAANRHELFPEVLLVPVALVLALVLPAWVLLGLALRRSPGKASLVVSAAVVCAFSFSHVRVRWMELGFGSAFVRHDLFNFLWAEVFLVLAFLVLRTKRDLRPLNRGLTIVAAFLVAVPTATIAAHELGGRAAASAAAPEAGADAFDRTPNVWVIVLDGYAHESTLREVFGHDNRPFLGELESLGFDVVEESRSNYALTFLSLASALNLEYFDASVDPDGKERAVPYAQIRDNRFVAEMRANGYRYVHVASGWGPTDADVEADVLVDCSQLGEFQRVLLHTTPLMLWPEVVLSGDRERVRCQFDEMKEVASTPGPRLVFAHLMLPHPPYVFGPNGEPVDPGKHMAMGYIDVNDTGEYEEKRRLYSGQLQYTNVLVLDLVRAILAEEDEPPVIVLLSDHGSDLQGVGPEIWADPSDAFFRERMRNFQAVLLPGGEGLVYETMTPVNTFRVVLTALGSERERLPDVSWYSDPQRPYRFRDVTDVADFE